MLTVREALKLPVFARATLVAGERGLDNQINWVHIIDIPDAHYEWDRQGVLLLTAGYGIHDDADRQASLIPKLVEQGFAGMVLAIGYYFQDVPEQMQQAANLHAFPLVKTPPDLLFIDVTEAVLERIVNRQYALLVQSNQIFSQLTDLVLRGADLQDVAETLAELLQRSITIESASFHVLANAEHGGIDAARERSVARGRTNPDLAQHLLDAGIYERLLEKKRPLSVPPIPALDMEMGRFVAPVIVDREIVGYIWIIAGERPLTELDELAISHGATVAALIRFKEQAVRQAREEQYGDFIDWLLADEIDVNVLVSKARQLRVRLDRRHQVLVIQEAETAVQMALQTLAGNVGAWLRRQGMHPIYTLRDNHLLVIVESDEINSGVDLARKLVAELNHPAQRLLVGVGNVCRPLQEAPHSLRQGHAQAREALHIGQMMELQEGVICFHDLGVLHWLYHLPPAQWSGNAYLTHVQTLAAYDSERDTQLVHTLERYLDHGGALAETAQALYIHRNTLLHRIRRIEKLCDLDLRAPLQRLNLHVAVKSYRLRRNLGN